MPGKKLIIGLSIFFCIMLCETLLVSQLVFQPKTPAFPVQKNTEAPVPHRSGKQFLLVQDVQGDEFLAVDQASGAVVQQSCSSAGIVCQDLEKGQTVALQQ